ncbi:hypothetical protein K439DRAFT_1646883 [Ramaria rubella]|nr:hypothetical protein K439DRAFT_1646883 [Ramaria rubella]
MAAPQSCPGTSTTFLEIKHHPHTGLEPEFIFCDLPVILQDSENNSEASHSDPGTLWAPFRTQADFEFAEMTVQAAMHGDTIKRLLHGIKMIGQTLDIFQESKVEAKFEGKTYTYKFLFQDPWKWILTLIQDPSFAFFLILYPVKNILHRDGKTCHVYDEINTGQTWWDIQDKLPHGPDEPPHCFLPLHIWMDKGKVSSTVTMHPILGRPGFLPLTIPNGSGNGGGTSFGYMIRVKDPGDPDDRSQAETAAFATFKWEVYHKVLQIIFKSLENSSLEGEAVTFGDGIVCVAVPGFTILSLDMEEAGMACGTQAATAEHPCPRCLVQKCDLHIVTKPSTLHIAKEMWKIYKEALAVKTKAAAANLLKKYGLHLVLNAFWSLGNSDPHLAYFYDTLHNAEGGVFGRHLFPLVLIILADLGLKGNYSQNMQQVPSWPGLKHFESITTMEFSDGQSYFDALKLIVPCIVQLLPTNSPLVHCLCLFACIHMIAGLHRVTEHYLDKLQEYLKEYEDACMKVENIYGKSFDFPKQHMLVHFSHDIIHKGATINYSTRVGEGFQQKSGQAYELTNHKNVEAQMTKVDEIQEAIGSIRIAVDAYDAEILKSNEQSQGDIEEDVKTSHDRKKEIASPQGHWSLGSPEKLFPEAKTDGTSMTMQIFPFKCIYIHYQSLEDWSTLRDIARCSPLFNGQPRHDCVIINTALVSYAHLCFVFRCFLDSGPEDIVIHRLTASKWSPKTKWRNYQVFEEAEYDFVLLKYVVCACHMIPTFIPNDMFLRCGNVD